MTNGQLVIRILICVVVFGCVAFGAGAVFNLVNKVEMKEQYIRVLEGNIELIDDGRRAREKEVLEETKKLTDELEELRKFKLETLVPISIQVSAQRSVHAYKHGAGDWTRTRQQGVMLARVMANENSRVLRNKAYGGTEGEFTADTHGIAEVVLNNRTRLIAKRHGFSRKVLSWDEVIGELAPHVTKTVKIQLGKQHEWTSTLPADGSEKPSGWNDERHGNWSLYAKNWETFREKVVDAWLKDTFQDVPGRPIGWGNEQDLINARRRGLCVIEGVGDANGFVAPPGKGCNGT